MTTHSVVIQKQEQDVGCIGEREVQTATLDSKTSDEMEKGYTDIVERQVRMWSSVFAFKVHR